MANTFFNIAKVTLTGNASSIQFTSIPNTYTDLLICHSLRTDRASFHESLTLEINGTGANRTYRRIYASNSITADNGSTSYGGQTSSTQNTPSTAFGTSILYISAYTVAKSKISLEMGGSEGNNSNTLRDMVANIWADNSVITSILLQPENGGSLLSGSTAYLYGIKNT